MRKGIPLILIFFLLLLNSASGEFSVTWRDCEYGLIHHLYYVDIQNLEYLKEDFDLSLFFSDTSYQIEKTSATISEWKGLDTEFPTYDTRIVNKICYGYDNLTEIPTEYDCSYSEIYQNGTEIKKLNQWKSTKAQLTKIDALIKSNYGLINIPEFDSKPKYDDFGSIETTEGTKYFKVEWDTPLIKTSTGWGSSGKVGFFDDLTGIEYHPYWNIFYGYATQLIINLNDSAYATHTMQPVAVNITTLSGDLTYLSLVHNNSGTWEEYPFEWFFQRGDSHDYAGEVIRFLVNLTNNTINNEYWVYTSDTATVVKNSTIFKFFDGAEVGNMNEWTESHTAVDNIPSALTSGSYYFNSTTSGEVRDYYPFSPALDNADIHICWIINNWLAPTDNNGIEVPQTAGSSTGQFMTYYTGDGTYYQYDDGASVIGSLPLNIWKPVCMKNVDTSGADGTVDWWVNNAFVASKGTRETLTSIGAFHIKTTNGGGNLLVDDIYVSIGQDFNIYPVQPTITLGQNLTPPAVLVNTSIYAATLNISDFSFSSTSYIKVTTINFSTTKTKNLTFLSSFNLKKLTGALSNNIRVNITIDGTQILEERVRTLKTNVDEGATGTSPVPFSLSPGTHNLTFYIRKETGNGAIEINDINAVIIQFLSTQDYNITEGLTTVDTTFSDTSLTEIAQIPLEKITNSSRFLTSKFDIKADATTTVVCRSECLYTGEVSDYVVRYLEDSDDTGTIFLTFLDSIETPSHNFTLKCLSTTGATVTINGSVISTVMKDQNNNTIQNHVSGNISTNYSSTLTLTAGTHKLANSTAYLQNGTGLLISGISSFGSNTGSQTPYIFINVSGVSESQCYTKLERYLSGNLDIGNLGIFYLCDGLTVGFNYSVNLWLNVPTGEEVTLYDETLSHFEISSFNISVANTPPIVAILEPAVDQVMDQDGLINWTITDLLGDRYQINITLWNSTNTSQVAFLPDTEGSYTFNFSSLADGYYNLTIESCENETADLFCSNFTIQIIIATNLPPTASLNSPDDNGTDISIPPTLNVTVIDPNANVMNITFYNESDSILCANLSIVSGLDVYCLWPDLLTNTTYFWYVIVTDGTFPVTSDTWNFTTSVSTTTTTTTTTTTLGQNLTGLMQVILDDRTMSEHKICIYQLIGWEDNDTQESGIRPNLILCFNSPNTYLSQHSNSELLKITIAEDCDYIIKVQKQREDFLASPSNFLNGLLQNLGYLIMALIVVLSSFAIWKKLS